MLMLKLKTYLSGRFLQFADKYNASPKHTCSQNRNLGTFEGMLISTSQWITKLPIILPITKPYRQYLV